jgi:exonuclease V gamma subunit
MYVNDAFNKNIGFANDNEEWTTECVVDELFFSLVKKSECITNDKGRTIHIRKYYFRAREILKWIPISKPAPIFIINITDLPEKIIKELEQVKENETITYILTQAVGRIFENLDFKCYHMSIARKLSVRLET